MPVVPTGTEREQESDNGAVGMDDQVSIRPLNNLEAHFRMAMISTIRKLQHLSRVWALISLEKDQPWQLTWSMCPNLFLEAEPTML